VCSGLRANLIGISIGPFASEVLHLE